MQVCELQTARFRRVVLTIGNFDGVHRGHQAILAAGRQRADAAGTQLVAMTFDPHPSALLTPDRIPATLTPPPEKHRCLGSAGADVIVVVKTSPEFLAITADRFVKEIILDRFDPVAVVEGASFGYGAHRQGDVNTLREAGATHGFDVEIIEPVRVALGGHPDTVISSSLVRHLLHSGTVDRAAQCLGRPYALLGQVVHGAGRGHTLGFPTANLRVEQQLLPAESVYAGRAFVLDARTSPAPTADIDLAEAASKAIPAAISIGRKPTFDDHELAIEAFLLDYEGDLYGRTLRIELLDWLRPQQRYDSAEDLCREMETDVARTRALFATSQS